MKPQTRRTFLCQTAGAGLCLMAGNSGSAQAKQLIQLGLTIASCGIRARKAPASAVRPPFQDAMDFLQHGQQLGAAGIQTGVSRWTSALAARLRDYAQSHQLFLEGQIKLPDGPADLDRFDQEVRVAREAGVEIFRAVMLGTRRYETFTSLEAFREFQRRSWQSLVLAEPVVRKHRVRLALENHKDWLVPELLDIITRIQSEYVGVCVDLGNSLALLEDPMAVVTAYAPHAFTTHFKDMAVQEYADGFLLSEVPLGEGFLDLATMVDLLRAANSEVRFNLEMITRDPLRVPCLRPEYFATFPALPAHFLAEALGRVRGHPPTQPLPHLTGLSPEAQLELEETHNVRSFKWAQSQSR